MPYTAESDDPYASLGSPATYLSMPSSSNQYPPPTYIVARMPGSTTTQIDGMLQSAVNRHNSPNTQTFISTVSPSFVGKKTGANILDVLSYWTTITNQFSSEVFGTNCNTFLTNQPGCLAAPPDCLREIITSGVFTKTSTLYQCSNAGQFSSDMTSYGVQFYVCGGNGISCHAVFTGNNFYDVVSASDVPKLSSNPIVFTMGCYDSSINNAFIKGYDNPTSSGNSDSIPAPGVQTLAHSFMTNGTAAYIGDTEETAINWGKAITNTGQQSVGSIPEMVSIYQSFEGGKTIGQAFLQMKDNNEYYYSDPIAMSGAEELQLYGDPTLQH